MFGKLLKHEFKVVSGPLGIASLAVLAAGIIGGIIIRVELAIGTSAAAEMENLGSILGLLLPFVFLGILAYAIAGGVLPYVRFYRNKFTDEGYLTFTLPVAGWQIFLASLLNILFWGFVVILVMFLSIGLLFGIALSAPETLEALREQWSVIEESFLRTWEAFLNMDGVEIHWWDFLLPVIENVSGAITIMTCMTLGAVMAQKHKILAGVGMYYLFSMLTSIVTSMAMTGAYSSGDMAALNTAQTVNMVYTVLVAIGGFALSSYLMEKKLNLP